MSTRKSYKDWTDAEKAEYKRKDAEREQRKADERNALFAKLEAELKSLNASAEALNILQTLKNGVKLEKGARLSRLFGTETPAPGTVVTFLWIGARGANGERLLPNEDIAGLVKRTGNATFVKNLNIHEDVWYLKKQGYDIVEDDVKAIVTFKNYPSTTVKKPLETILVKSEANVKKSA